MPKRAAPLTKAQKQEAERQEHERFLELAKSVGADEETPELLEIVGRSATPSRARKKG